MDVKPFEYNHRVIHTIRVPTSVVLQGLCSWAVFWFWVSIVGLTVRYSCLTSSVWATMLRKTSAPMQDPNALIRPQWRSNMRVAKNVMIQIAFKEAIALTCTSTITLYKSAQIEVSKFYTINYDYNNNHYLRIAYKINWWCLKNCSNFKNIP